VKSGFQGTITANPPSFDDLDVTRSFFDQIDRRGLTLVWEFCGKSDVRSFFEAWDMAHGVDSLRALPKASSGKNIVYFRLHGLGPRMYGYKFSDDELRRGTENVQLIRSVLFLSLYTPPLFPLDVSRDTRTLRGKRSN